MKRPTSIIHAAIAALVLTGLAGCAAGNATPAALATAAIPTGQARVTVERPMAYLYSGAPATITANGKNVASIWGGGSSSFFIPAGESTIAASAWSYPGEFKVKLNAAAGADYKLVVEPRGDSFVPGTLLARLSHRGTAATETKSTTGKEKHAMRCGSSDEWFDAACRRLRPARRVALARPSAASAASTVSGSYAFQRPPGSRTRANAMATLPL